MQTEAKEQITMLARASLNMKRQELRPIKGTRNVQI